jgi:hypothetical protein
MGERPSGPPVPTKLSSIRKLVTFTVAPKVAKPPLRKRLHRNHLMTLDDPYSDHATGGVLCRPDRSRYEILGVSDPLPFLRTWPSPRRRGSLTPRIWR